jgi:hypothetical protein
MGRWKDLAEDARNARFEALLASGMTEDEAVDAMIEEQEKLDARDPS